MGYETKLYVGEIWSHGERFEVQRDYYTDDYRTPLKTIKVTVGKERTNMGTHFKEVETPYFSEYFSVMAMFDLCKCGHESEIGKLEHRKAHKVEVSLNDIPSIVEFYSPIDTENNRHIDGEINNKITEDSYGNYMVPIPIDEVIEALEKDVQNDDYRRFKFTLASLKAIKETCGDKIFVAFYGY